MQFHNITLNLLKMGIILMTKKLFEITQLGQPILRGKTKSISNINDLKIQNLITDI